jgi:hypothetical protein
MAVHMKDRKYVPLHSISEYMSHDDIPGDWVTIGIVSNKVTPKATKNGDTFDNLTKILFGRHIRPGKHNYQTIPLWKWV